ncbi:CoA-binding protein [Halotalea alkalilenta]|uniref:CoA-binding protein n=1 Tax=Halotalea alkalilenta TaxID=376489 RepID=UPI000AA2AB0C|nr:CoA-binding protein [Halotalea alkalilenta]
MNDDAIIRALLGQPRSIALVGASDDPLRPSHSVMQRLLAHGHRLHPVNPTRAGRMILGCEVVANLADIQEPIDIVDVFRRSDAVDTLVNEVLMLSPMPEAIWLQLGVRDPVAEQRARQAGVTVIVDRCPAIEIARLAL